MMSSDNGDLRPLSDVLGDNTLHHGGVVSEPGLSDKDSADDLDRLAAAFQESIERGMDALHRGAGEFAPGVQPVPGASVETLDFYDVQTGEHHLIWRVPCYRVKRAN
jgi:hypothetical protein